MRNKIPGPTLAGPIAIQPALILTGTIRRSRNQSVFRARLSQ
jgi:hypothetical protein